MSRCSRTAAYAGVHSPKTAVENILKLAQCEIGDLNLTDLRNDDETLACDVDCVGDFDIAGQNEHEPIARAKAVVLVDRAGQIRIEL
jgi:hypothetical protein